MKKYKVAFATGSRADYGIVRRYLSLLNHDEEVDFSILATGALLDDSYGRAVSLVENDGFRIEHEYRTKLHPQDAGDTVHIMAEVLDDYGRYFARNAYDLIIILGDRYEIYSVAIAASINRQPILHIHGGELTLANYDEFIRHSITKMSRWHITSTEIYRRRVIQLGEAPETVFNLGALGAENCLAIDESNVSEAVKSWTGGFVVLFHPETLYAGSPLLQTEELLAALKPYSGRVPLTFIGSNADSSSDVIQKKIKEFCDTHNNCHFVENLHPDAYHWLVRRSIALVGNSSSGIIEAPSLGTYTVNIGNRQTGRVKSRSIIDTSCECHAIGQALLEAESRNGEPITDTPYYQPNTAQRYYEATKKMLATKLPEFKTFNDISFTSNQ